MTAVELIEKIDNKLANLSEEKLEDILKYVDERSIAEDIDIHLNRIILEDDNLLRKLAQ